MHPKSLSKNKIALAAASLTLTLGALTVLYALREEAGEFPGYETLLDFNPQREGGHLLPDKNLRVRSGTQGISVRWVTNSKGFRNTQEFPYIADEGTYRILFLGDSFVDGHRTDQEKTIGYLMEQALSAALPKGGYSRCEVLISGHNNPTTAWYGYQEHGSKYQPDLVILGISLSNDITWNNYGVDMRPVTSPEGVVTLEWSGRLETDSWSQPNLYLADYAYCSDQILGQRWRERRDTRWSGDHIPYPSPPESSRRRVAAADFTVSLGLFLQPLMPEIEAMYVGFEEVLKSFSTAVKRDGSKMLVAVFPTRIQVYHSQWFALTQLYALDAEAFDLGLPNQRIRSALERADVPFVDLLPEFLHHGEELGQPLFRKRGDSHFNEHAQAITADALTRSVLSLMTGHEPDEKRSTLQESSAGSR